MGDPRAVIDRLTAAQNAHDGVLGERIAWARLYVDEVERAGAGIDAAVRRMAGADDS